MPDTFPLSSIKQDRINLLIKMAHCTYIYNIYLSSLSFFNSTCTINPVYTTMGTVLINFKITQLVEWNTLSFLNLIDFFNSRWTAISDMLFWENLSSALACIPAVTSLAMSTLNISNMLKQKRWLVKEAYVWVCCLMFNRWDLGKS